MLHRYGLGLVPPHRFANALAIAGSVSWLTPASGAVLHSGFPQTVGGLASGVSTVRLYWAGSMTLAATATVVAGAWSTTVTPAAAQVGETSLLAVAGGARAALTIVVRATPLDLNAVGWWISNNGALADSGSLVPFGSVTLDEASVGADVTAWTRTPVGLGVTAGQADPAGGSSAFLLTETSDGGPTVHEFDGSATVVAPVLTGLVWHDFWYKFDGRPAVEIVINSGGYRAVFGSDGSVGYSSANVTASLVETVGDWRHFRVIFGLATGVCGFTIRPADSNDSAGRSYTGDGRNPGYLYLPQVIQPRVALIADESLTALGAARNAHMVQGNDASQPLFYTGFASVNGLPVAYTEPGRSARVTATHADVTTAFSGIAPNFAVIGVLYEASGNDNSTSYFAYGTGEYDWIYLQGADVRSLRTGASPSTISWAGAGTPLRAGPCTFALLNYGSNNTRRLYVAGVDYGAQVMGASADLTIAGMHSGHSSVTNIEAYRPELAVLSGELTYAQLRPTLQAMGARWGGLAA